ncbi:MAG: HK97 gp10 family phage protein [Clostridium sp.]|nr:HK97 gp10 family phage protein [Clostridium sp.]
MRWGSADFRQLQELERKIDKLERADFAKFCREAAKELAQRLLAKVVKRTPVGDYSGDAYVCETGQSHQGRYVPGKVGGTLRRGWTVGEVEKESDEYRVEIINPVEYAPYVEYGHRTANGKGWVNGHFMLTISVQEVENLMPALLEKRLYELLKGLF